MLEKKSINHIGFSNNGVTDDMLYPIIETIKENRSLNNFDLSNNEIRFSGNDIIFSLNKNNIKDLNLSNNSMNGYMTEENLKRAEIFSKEQFDALKINKNMIPFKKINLSHNKVMVDNYFLDFLLSMPPLVSFINISHNEISINSTIPLLTKLEKSKSITKIGFSYNKFLENIKPSLNHYKMNIFNSLLNIILEGNITHMNFFDSEEIIDNFKMEKNKVFLKKKNQ